MAQGTVCCAQEMAVAMDGGWQYERSDGSAVAVNGRLEQRRQ